MKINFSISFETGRKENENQSLEAKKKKTWHFPWKRFWNFLLINFVATLPFFSSALSRKLLYNPVFFWSTLGIFCLSSVFAWEYLINIKKRHILFKFFFGILRIAVISLTFVFIGIAFFDDKTIDGTVIITIGAILPLVVEALISYGRYGENNGTP